MPAFARHIPAWLLALFLAFMGLQKFIGDVPIFAIIEANVAARTGIEAGFIEPQGRWLTGVLEFAAAALLIVQRRWGILLSLAVIAGAILAHLTFLGISTPVSGAPDAESSPMLFFMALGALALTLGAAWLDRKPAA